MNFKMPTAYVDVPCKWTSSTYSDMSEEERLKAENAKLRDENAKLLRLLRALALCADDNADCDKCVMNGAVYSSARQTFCNGMADELLAVGIVVD